MGFITYKSLFLKALLVGSFSLITISYVFGLERIRWKVQSGFAGEDIEGPFKNMFKNIKIISEGKITFRYYKSNSIIPNNELWPGIKEGNLDSAFAGSSFNANKIPALMFFTAIPFGPRLIEYKAWMQHGGGQAIKDKIYKQNGLYSIDCMSVPPESGGWFKKRMKSLKDLKGIRMRVYPGYGAYVFQKFGVKTKQVGLRDIMKEFEKGFIDAAEFSIPSWDLFLGLQKAAKYNYYPGWYQPTTIIELIINKKKWDGISKEAKLIINTACESLLLKSTIKFNAMQPKAMEELKKQGTTFVSWKDSELQKFKKTWHEIAEEESAKDQLFAEVYASYKVFREKYAIWGDRAYLK